MCVDIQGVDDLYTDPQLHTYPPVNPDSEDHVTGPDGDTASVSGGEGDLGIMGYALFFRTHRCNAVCKMLGLREFEHPPIPAGTPGIRHSEQSDYFDSTVPKDSAVGLGLSITPRKQRFESLYRRPSTNKAKKAADPDANPALKSPERLEVPFIPTLPRRKSAEFPHLKRRRSHPAKPEETDQLLSILALTHRTLARAFLVPGKLPVFNSDEYQPNPESAALFHYEAAAKLGDSAAAWYLSVAYDPERDDPEGELDELEQADGQRLPFIPKSQRSLEKVVEWTKCAADAGSVAACLRMADLSADSAEKLSWLEKALGFLGERRMLMSRDSTDFAFYHSRTLLSDLVAAESRFPHRSDLVPQAAEWAICAAMASLCEGETAAEWWERAAEECVEVGLGKKAEGFYMKAEEMRS